MSIANLILVEAARLQIRDEEFPHTAAPTCPHGVAAPVPVIEIAHDADPLGIRGPDGKQNAGDVVDHMVVGAEKAVGVTVLALAKQMQIKVR